jgi:hypothetical protein
VGSYAAATRTASSASLPCFETILKDRGVELRIIVAALNRITLVILLLLP